MTLSDSHNNIDLIWIRESFLKNQCVMSDSSYQAWNLRFWYAELSLVHPSEALGALEVH